MGNETTCHQGSLGFSTRKLNQSIRYPFLIIQSDQKWALVGASALPILPGAFREPTVSNVFYGNMYFHVWLHFSNLLPGVLILPAVNDQNSLFR